MKLSTLLEKLPNRMELLKRAELLAKADAALPYSFFKFEDSFQKLEDSKGEYIRHYWEDGGGQTALAFFTEEHVLLLAFDHESEFNFYADEDDDSLNQASFYEGLPKDLDRFVFNVPETNMQLNIVLPDDETVVAASAVAWFDGHKWAYSPAFDLLSEAVGHEEDGGFSYCFRFLLIEGELTKEKFTEHFVNSGYEKEEVLESLGQVWEDSSYSH